MNRRIIRASIAALFLLTYVFSAPLVQSVITDEKPRYTLPQNGTGEWEDAESITLITGDSTAAENERGQGPRNIAEIVAVDRSGNVLYRNATYDKYWDVDPVPNGKYTVIYAASVHLDDCDDAKHCYRDLVVRHNLSTDDASIVYERVHRGAVGFRWHDVDRLPDGNLLVANIANDSVYEVDPETERVAWSWNARSHYDRSSGGPFPGDWTHLNDVEHLSDGRVMVSLRNQDQVVFLSNGTVDDSWTLGSDDDHGVLYEQHNPDYLRHDGTRSVLVADSENNRVVEYERRDGSWKQTWEWTDSQLLWPRDADRLPNGHTVITDSNGNRVVEIDERGIVVWSYDIAFPYEAERLGTGDESQGGPPASVAEIESSTTDNVVVSMVGSVFPDSIVNALAYVKPSWMSFSQLVVSIAGITVWACIEICWFGRRIKRAVDSDSNA